MITEEQVTELKRIRRLADNRCSSHALLRERYSRLATGLDVVILTISLTLATLAFIDEEIASKALAVGAMSTNVGEVIGIMALITAFLTLLQIKVDWKGKSDAHTRAFRAYAILKQESGNALNNDTVDTNVFNRIVHQDETTHAVAISIPENQFLKLKQHHLTKVKLSKHLDLHPSASILFTRMKFWFQDNF